MKISERLSKRKIKGKRLEAVAKVWLMFWRVKKED